MQTYVVIEGLGLLDMLSEIPAHVETAAFRAVNKTAMRARTAASKAIREQVNLPASYLNGDRLTVKKAHRGSELMAKVVGRDRPTSLARFARGGVTQRRGASGIKVAVKRGGKAHFLPRTFIIQLRSGNVGLAMRTDGGAPSNAYKPKPIGASGKLWLLYGPSVDQVLFSARRQSGVFTEIAPAQAEFLEREFFRLLSVEID